VLDRDVTDCRIDPCARLLDGFNVEARPRDAARKVPLLAFLTGETGLEPATFGFGVTPLRAW